MFRLVAQRCAASLRQTTSRQLKNRALVACSSRLLASSPPTSPTSVTDPSGQSVSGVKEGGDDLYPTLYTLRVDAEDMDAETFDRQWEMYFNRPDLDDWDLRRAINEFHQYDHMPEPKIVEAMFRACRRLNDLAMCIRIQEILLDKAARDADKLMPYMMQELKPVMDELGIPTLAELEFNQFCEESWGPAKARYTWVTIINRGMAEKPGQPYYIGHGWEDLPESVKQELLDTNEERLSKQGLEEGSQPLLELKYQKMIDEAKKLASGAEAPKIAA